MAAARRDGPRGTSRLSPTCSSLRLARELESLPGREAASLSAPALLARLLPQAILHFPAHAGAVPRALRRHDRLELRRGAFEPDRGAQRLPAVARSAPAAREGWMHNPRARGDPFHKDLGLAALGSAVLRMLIDGERQQQRYLAVYRLRGMDPQPPFGHLHPSRPRRATTPTLLCARSAGSGGVPDPTSRRGRCRRTCSPGGLRDGETTERWSTTRSRARMPSALRV